MRNRRAPLACSRPRADIRGYRRSRGNEMKAKVTIALKPGVLDPQGAAITQALAGLGFDEVRGARVGKIIELDLAEADRAAVERRLREMCERLLANTVIEDYAVELEAPL